MRLYFVFFGLFDTFMLASLETGNLGMLFVLIEGSTLASVVLVGLEAKARSLEAAWKYVIISSLGVTVALVGTLYLFYSGSALQLTDSLRLAWPFLYAHAAELSLSEPAVGVPARGDWLRHEGRVGPDAHVAAGRACRGAAARPARCCRRPC